MNLYIYKYTIVLLLISRHQKQKQHKTMPKLTKQEKKEKQAILNAMGVKITIIPPPEYNKIECSICLKKIHKGEQKTLECGHMFHSSCILKWALKTANDTGLCECQQPTKN